MSTEGGERNGRPKAVVTDKNIQKIYKMILNDRTLKLNEISDTLKIPTEYVYHIIQEYLVDETWLHHFTPKSNRHSSEWTAHDESAPKREKMQQSAVKFMVSVFSDAHGIIFIGYIEIRRTINSDYYIALLDRLKDEIGAKRLHLKKKKVLLHQDNAPCHKSVKTKSKIHELAF
ncbi:hypothetical protein GWI33_017426 [Rhynchophorus ferrugineus]|uniref:Transposase n=1 Tax=Rhynchophorus ferrugineus TaxID=354439 RepID=A0A834M2F2_RHYFE|nr:hypothetical protein GWI33_017426 [Rhynchophorus ferrugineus]